MTTKLLFDLDGTLVDSTKRLYHLFQHLVPHSSFSYDDYWELKRNMQTHSIILDKHFQYEEKLVRDFEEKWMEEIEKENWLSFDEPFPGVTPFLQMLAGDYDLYLITARQLTAAAKKQVDSFGWNSLFKEVMVTNQAKEKAEIVLSFIVPSAQDWMIGDTGIDIQTGKQLGMKTAAVCSGFRSRAVLEKYQPDVIAEKVTDLVF
jgi:phosphoglycolate phosphatase